MTAAALPVFRAAATRHRYSQVYVVPVVLGSPISIDLNRVGYLSELRYHLFGTVTVSAAAAASDPDATSNYFPSIVIRSPQGDTPHSFSMRSILDWNYRLFPGVSPFTDPNFANFNPNATGAQAVDIRFIQSLSLNDNMNFETGMLMRQVSNNNFQLGLTVAQAGDLVGTGGSAISGTSLTLEIEEVYYEAVNPAVVTPPDFHTVVRLREYPWNNMASGGDNYNPYQPGPTVLDAMMRVMSNGVGDHADVARIKLYANKQTYIDNRTGDDIRAENYRHLGKALRAGVFHLDYFDDRGIVNQTSARDFLNTNDAAQLDFVLQTKSTFNATNSSMVALFRELVTLGV